MDHLQEETPKETEAGKKPPIGIDGKTWIKYSVSIWDVVKTSKEQALGHPAMFPLELCNRLIKLYSWENEIVLDPFMGSGSTLSAAKSLGRKGIGFEIQPEFIKLANKRFSQNTIDGDNSLKPRIIEKDSRGVAKELPEESVDFVLTSPPYWDILNSKRTADYKEARPYSSSEEDLGNITSYEGFMAELAKVFRGVWTALKRNRYCAIVVMDIRKQDQFYPFHIDVTRMMQDIGFTLDDIIIWDRRQEYNNLRALGYPYVFRVNKVHEYILIFQKRVK